MASHLIARKNALFCNQGVTSSNLVGGTSIFNGLAISPLLFLHSHNAYGLM